MDNREINKPYYDFCADCIKHKKYKERMLPNDEIYECIRRVGLQFPNYLVMLESFIHVLDMFEEYIIGTRSKVNTRNMYICGSVYASLFFIGFAIEAAELHKLYIYVLASTGILYDAYHPEDGKFTDDPDELVKLIEEFRKDVNKAKLPYYALNISYYFAMASAIISNLPAYVPNYEGMRRAGDIIIRRNARLCRTRRKHHDAAKIITQLNQWRIQPIVEVDKHESD